MKRKEMMNKLTACALELSIQKWKDLAKGKDLDYANDEENCALCEIFSSYDQCGDCPVKLKTGEYGCVGTPYSRFDLEADDFQKVALEEVEFLKSLRKKEATTR